MNGVWEMIRKLREEHGYTQSFVGRRLGMSQQMYSNYEMGKKDLEARHIITLAELYHVSSDYICGITAESFGEALLSDRFAGDFSYREVLKHLARLDESQRNAMLHFMFSLERGQTTE